MIGNTAPTVLFLRTSAYWALGSWLRRSPPKPKNQEISSWPSVNFVGWTWLSSAPHGQPLEQQWACTRHQQLLAEWIRTAFPATPKGTQCQDILVRPRHCASLDLQGKAFWDHTFTIRGAETVTNVWFKSTFMYTNTFIHSVFLNHFSHIYLFHLFEAGTGRTSENLVLSVCSFSSSSLSQKHWIFSQGDKNGHLTVHLYTLWHAR